MERISLFLSAAEEDGTVGREIADWLTSKGFRVYYWQDRRGGLFIEEIERAINDAGAFIALISPHFLSSIWCNGERELAMLREQDLRVEEPDRIFISVLQIADTPYSQTGFLRRYDWTNLTIAETKEQELDNLATRLRSRSPTEPSDTRAASRATSLFRNRQDELQSVYRGLTNAAGPHFWLVTAPPQLGKTWFLNRLSADVSKAVSADLAKERGDAKPWVIRLVDIREQPPAVRRDPAAILAVLFGRTPPATADRDALRAIARDIRQSGRPHLCLLDSAEMLHEDTASALRSYLGSIYQSVQATGRQGVRLTLIVASRREHDWSGVFPEPPISTLSLTEFKIIIVEQALRHLAEQMELVFADTEYRQDAARVYRLSEGLPALLVRYLQWIRAEEWLDIDRLEHHEFFEKIAHPYIQGDLLSFDSLFPGSREPWSPTTAAKQRVVLEETFRVLAPYRLFTQSHLRHYIDSDDTFRRALTDLGWALEDLWQYISDTALLKRPLNEVWQELHDAIRRLLFRYYYRSDGDRAEAHRAAREFMKVWADKQVGKEQVMGLAECLWHEAAELLLRESGDMNRILSESANKLSTALAPSSAYSMIEVRNFAAKVISNDQELQEAVRHIPGLANRLAAIVATPQ